MCGAYGIFSFKEINEAWDISPKAASFAPRYNARPGQELPVIFNNKPRTVQLGLWGLKFAWSKGKPIINARADTINTKPSFKENFHSRRCVIPANFFYEWGILDGKKYPFLFELKNKKLFGLAGIWQKDSKTNSQEFAIITTTPNDLVAKIHDRMPVVLPGKEANEWLDEKTPLKNLEKLMRPLPAQLMRGFPVSSAVNLPRNDNPELIKPVKI